MGKSNGKGAKRAPFKQLGYRERVIIELATRDPGSSLAKCAEAVRAPRSTVMREIKRNLKESAPWVRPPDGAPASPCPKLSRWPFCCNLCGKASCSRGRKVYDAAYAEGRAAKRRGSAQRGPKRSSAPAIRAVEAAVCPLILKGYSVEAACAASGCDVPPKTIREWIEGGYLSAKRVDLPRAARFFNKKYDYPRPRGYVPARVALNRTISDFRAFMAEGRHFCLQADTVVGKATDKHCVLTMMDPDRKLQVCLRVRKTAAAVNEAVRRVWEAFRDAGCPFDAVLTDNGPEFQGLPDVERAPDGAVRFRAFYCDPYRSGQKGACERNHEILRYAIKKGESIDALSDGQVLEACSKMNSYPRRSLGMLSPFDAFAKRHQGAEKLYGALGLRRLAPDAIDFKKR